MAISVSVQYNGWFLPDITLSILCYYHRGTRSNAMKRFSRWANYASLDWGVLRGSIDTVTCFFIGEPV